MKSQIVKVNSDIKVPDSGKVIFGAGSDLQIYHDGSDSYIKHNGAGNLYVQTSEASVEDLYLQAGNDVYIRPQTGENGIHVQGDGNVSLYYDGSIKCYSTATGFKIHTSAHLQMGDSSEVRIGNGDDLKIYHDGTNSYIKDAGAGSLWVYSNDFRVASADGSENIIKATENGSVELYHNNSKKLETGVSGDYGSITFPSSTGDNSWEGVSFAGKCVLMSNGDSASPTIGLYNDTDNEWLVKANTGAAVELYYDGTKKFETTSTGVTIPATLKITDTELSEASDNFTINIQSGNNDFYVKSGGTTIAAFKGQDKHLEITDGNLVIGTAGHGIDFSAQTSTTQTNATPDNNGEILDHYEEGTWTPTLIGTGGSPSGGTFSINRATYIRVGRNVTVQAYVSWNNDWSSAAGQAEIGGLPWTISSATTGEVHYGGISIGFISIPAGFSAANEIPTGYPDSGSGEIKMYLLPSGAGAGVGGTVPAADWFNSFAGYIGFTATYRAHA